jgi:hypothetical protein
LDENDYPKGRKISDAEMADIKLNYYRLEAGRFEGFVSYGLKSFAHELT